MLTVVVKLSSWTGAKKKSYEGTSRSRIRNFRSASTTIYTSLWYRKHMLTQQRRIQENCSCVSSSSFTGVTTQCGFSLLSDSLPFCSSHCFLHRLTPTICKSSSVSAIHLFLGLPLVLVPIGFHCNYLLGVLLSSIRNT